MASTRSNIVACISDSILSRLITKDWGGGKIWDTCLTHLAGCRACRERQRLLLERAMALVSLDFEPWEWDAFRLYRLKGMDLVRIGLKLEKPWRSVSRAVCRVMLALIAHLNDQDRQTPSPGKKSINGVDGTTAA